MTSKTTTQKGQTTQESGPGKAIEPYWQELLSGASNIFKQNIQQPFTGQLYAEPVAAQRQAIDMMKAGAPELARGAGTVREMADRIASGEFLDVANNPYFKGAADTISSNVTRSLNRDWRPAVTDKAIGEGAYGGSGTASSNERMIRSASEAVANAQANLASNYFNTGAGLTGQIPSLYNQSNQMLQLPANTIGLAGTQEQSWNQAALDAALKKWQLEANDPLQQYSQFANLLNASGYRSSSGTSLQETTTPPPDLATMILQGALGAGSLAMGMGTGLPGMIKGFQSLGSIFK